MKNGMRRRVALVRTDVCEKCMTIIRVERISDLETTLAVKYKLKQCFVAIC
jgi:hypothetical protein